MISPEVSAREGVTRRVLIGMIVTLGIGGVGWVVWDSSRPSPSLQGVIDLADAGRLDEAETKLRAYLAARPDDYAADLLLAQVLLKRPELASNPARPGRSTPAQEALDILRPVRPANPGMAVALHLNRGRALDRLLRFDDAEAAWLEALRVSPTAPEAGWHLLNLYYLQGRQEEARRLALQLYGVEPDPHDRVLLLLELVRADARPPAPGSIIKLFEPVVQKHPDELHSAIALGLARTRAGQVEDGIDQLRRAVGRHPDSVVAWEALLTGLDESGQIDLIEDELARVPAGVAQSPRLLKHAARVAQDRHRWKDAVALFRTAQAAEPYDRTVEYRLSRALRHTGELAEAERIDRRVRMRDVAIQELRPLYDKATETPGLGILPQPVLYQRIADARERMQRPDEARAWHRLVLAADPRNAVSRAALARLGEAADAK
jgi:tetratricopeptide (TPR) repeat protein